MYYLRSKSKARIAMVKLLKDMLFIEAKDKEFLLANITRVTQDNGNLNSVSQRKWINDYLLFIIYRSLITFFNWIDWLMDDLLPKQRNPLNRYGRRMDRNSDGNLSRHINREFSFHSADCSTSSRKECPNRSFSSIDSTTIMNGNKTNSMITKDLEIDSI